MFPKNIKKNTPVHFVEWDYLYTLDRIWIIVPAIKLSDSEDPTINIKDYYSEPTRHMEFDIEFPEYFPEN